jgi:hypothetical protein
MDSYKELLKKLEQHTDEARSSTVSYVHAFITNQKTAAGNSKSSDNGIKRNYDGFIYGYIHGACDASFQVFDKSAESSENWHLGAFELFMFIFMEDDGGAGGVERAAEDAARVLFDSEKYMTSSSGDELFDKQFQLGVMTGGKEIKKFIELEMNGELPEDKQSLYSNMSLAKWLLGENE